jgi:DNA-binding IclR family transcriptional regulator
MRCLGSFALELGLSALARLDPVTLAAPVLTELREATGQTGAKPSR